MEPVSPALSGVFLTPGLPGKSPHVLLQTRLVYLFLFPSSVDFECPERVGLITLNAHQLVHSKSQYPIAGFINLAIRVVVLL